METKPGKTEITKISDLDFASLDIKAETPEGIKAEAELQPNSLNFRIDSRHFKKKKHWDGARILKYVAMLLVLVLGTSVLLRFVDEVREAAIEDVKDLASASKKKKFGKIAVPILSKVSLALKAHRPGKVQDGIESSTNSAGTCSDFISDAINKRLKSKLSDEEFIHVVNCALFQDSVKAAQANLQKAGHRLGVGIAWDQISVSLLSLETARRMNPLSPLPIFAKQGCVRWAPLPDCFLRYVDESRLSFKSRWQDGLKVLEPVLQDRGAVEQAWFYAASSLFATKDGEYARADGFLMNASEALKGANNPFLERDIYRHASINAHLSNDANLMRKARTFRPLYRVQEDPRAFLDIELLEEISSPKAKELIQEYLQSSESKLRFVSDPRFLSILLKSAQLYGVHTEALTLATSVFGSDPKVENFGEPLVLLYARLLVGAGKAEEALRVLDKIVQAGYQSHELFHLKGLAFLLPIKGKISPLLAAKEFQTAAGISKNEESLFAMMIALLSSANASKAEQVMKQWKSLGPKAEKAVWYLFADGIMLYKAGNKVEAEAVWLKAEKVSRNKEIWKTLRSNLEKDPTFLDRDLSGSLRYLLPVDSPLGSLALSSQKS